MILTLSHNEGKKVDIPLTRKDIVYFSFLMNYLIFGNLHIFIGNCFPSAYFQTCSYSFSLYLFSNVQLQFSSITNFWESPSPSNLVYAFIAFLYPHF